MVTVDDFLARGAADVLAVKGCGPATYARLRQRVDQHIGQATGASLLSGESLGFSASALRLDGASAAKLEKLASPGGSLEPRARP